MIHVREARASDALTIAEFNCATAEESEGRRLDRARVEAGVRRALGHPELCRYFVAEVDGRIVGQVMITFEWSDWKVAVRWWLQSVYVRPDSRRGGVCEAMYRHVERLARRDPDVCGLRLYCKSQNHRAIAAYEKLGMRRMDQFIYDLDVAS